MSQTQDTAAPAAPNRRGNLLRGLFVIVVLLLAALALWYFMFGRWFEETDDAYVQGNQVQITPLVAGTVVAINADDGMRVERGQLLVQLDPSTPRWRCSRPKPTWPRPCARLEACTAAWKARRRT